jgi:hypothetical protein
MGRDEIDKRSNLFAEINFRRSRNTYPRQKKDGWGTRKPYLHLWYPCRYGSLRFPAISVGLIEADVGEHAAGELASNIFD